jgi:chromosome segregation ATPase
MGESKASQKMGALTEKLGVGAVTKKGLFLGLGAVALFALILGNIMWTQMNKRIAAVEEQVAAMRSVNQDVKAMMQKTEESISAISATAGDLENTAKVLGDLQAKVQTLEGSFGELRQDMQNVVSLAGQQGEAMKKAMEMQRETLAQLTEIVSSQEALLRQE